ncbi:MAG: ATP-binding protein [Ectothiorhodospiraceae bacterium AqS1]|nr:ATP-binding protein [Ectothiorhodospiraceae bacterium AqS1]MBF2761627.1 ATP-binding protein [Ectothiorhodospiraceae bacterium AqS1]
MKENATKVLNDLYELGNNWVKASKKRKINFEKLLSDFYPDRAHFIFELLQNAEDADASTVRFNLTKDDLTVKHNGSRLFSSEDVESITNIAHSTKRDDVNKIGKFGIGFKAAFSYSMTPRIYSGKYNFEIQNLICPYEISSVQKNNQETIFSFPFNNPSKTKDSCFREIKSVFESLDHTILLFLNNIQTIEWNIEEEHNGLAVREHIADTDEELIKISITNSSNDGLQEDAWFLRFQKALEKHGKLKCSIALKLGFRKESQTDLDSRKSLSRQMKIIPADGQLCVFFPAEKETTKLKLYVNGPYAATIDRASIKHEHEDNQEIMKATADLLVESMEHLRDIGLLTPDFLEVLPNDEDGLSPFYSIMKNAVYDALRKKALIPCLDGEYEKAGGLARGPKELTDIIDATALVALFNDDKVKWAAGVMRNSRSDKLLTSLDIPYYGYKELIDAVQNKYGYQRYWRPDYRALKWLKKQSDGWFQSFYLLLSTATRREEKEEHIDSWEIIKDQNGEILTGDDVYFPMEDNSAASNLSTVSIGIFEGLKKDRRNRLQKFLEAAGVKHIGELEEIQQILDRFYTEESKAPGRKRHLDHIKKFIEWNKAGNEMKIFQRYFIFLDCTDNYFLQPRHCYIDSPLEETGLGAIYSDGTGKDNSRSALWSGYAKVKDFVAFATACGARKTLEIERALIANNPRRNELYVGNHQARWNPSTGINEDYSIESLEEILEEKDVNISRLVWNILSAADPCVLKARYRPNRRYNPPPIPSSLVQILQRKKWIPAKDGQFHTPGEMSKNALRDDFEYDDRNGWLTAICFGEEEQKETEEYRIRQDSAQQLEITLDDVDLIKRLKKNPDLYEKTKRNVDDSSKPKEFPERPSADPKRRIQQATVRAEEASKKEYESRSRSVRISKQAGDNITYLEQSYTDDNDRLICQMCEDEMPFRRRDDRYYFETVQILDDLNKEHVAAYVALCPLCAARLRDDIAASKDLRIELDLSKESGSIRFVETHLLDIKALLDAENK